MDTLPSSGIGRHYHLLQWHTAQMERLMVFKMDEIYASGFMPRGEALTLTRHHSCACLNCMHLLNAHLHFERIVEVTESGLSLPYRGFWYKWILVVMHTVLHNLCQQLRSVPFITLDANASGETLGPSGAFINNVRPLLTLITPFRLRRMAIDIDCVQQTRSAYSSWP